MRRMGAVLAEKRFLMERSRGVSEVGLSFLKVVKKNVWKTPAQFRRKPRLSYLLIRFQK